MGIVDTHFLRANRARNRAHRGHRGRGHPLFEGKIWVSDLARGKGDIAQLLPTTGKSRTEQLPLVVGNAPALSF